MNSKVDWYLSKSKKWEEEMEQLRRIALYCGLTEELKWGCPCYTWHGSNVVLIHEFKEYCAYLFFKGALLNNAKGLLVQQTENVQAARQIRFTSIKQIAEQIDILKIYIFDAIDVEKAGMKVSLKKPTQFKIAKEFQNKMDELPALKTAFEALTPGRQRAYLLHFAAPKQAKTRASRVENCVEQIFNGKGLND